MITAERQEITVTLPPLHDSQREIAKHPARFKVVCCGRRWGKGILGITLSVRKAAKGGRVWWVAPTYSIALEGWTYLLMLVRGFPEVNVKTSRLRVDFPGGGHIEIKTGDNPDHLRGSGLDLVVLDEAASMKEEVWDLVLRPTLADRRGEAVFISTPKHFNWFWQLWERGEDPEQTDWASWQKPTWDNPFIPEGEIAAAQRDMETGDFDQEFGASFTAIGGAIFPLLSGNRPMYLRPMPAGLQFRRVGIGKDWGTTKQHKAAVVCGGITSAGQVWIRSAWESETGSANEWYDEDKRSKRDYGASFARVDRSQSSAIDHLKSMGFDADKGIADQEARIGDFQGLVRRENIFFDLSGPGVREYYQHLCEYHRDPETNKPVEEHDDDVDAGFYLVSELVRPSVEYNPSRRPVRPDSRPAVAYKLV